MQVIGVLLLAVGVGGLCFLYNIQHVLHGIWKDIGEIRNARNLEALKQEAEKGLLTRGY